MKCLPECGYEQMPNSGPALVNHMLHCDLVGPLKDIQDPVIVWRDSGFAVVDKAEKNERTYDLGFERVSHEIELPILDVDLVDGVNVEPVETTMSLPQGAGEAPEEE